MLNHKFGIEIEFTGITRNKAAKIAAKFLEDTISVCRDYYSKHTLKSGYTDFKASSFAAGSKEAICFF